MAFDFPDWRLSELDERVEEVPGPVINVGTGRYGASGDGSRDETAAFVKAVADINAAGGGTLIIPRGDAATYKVASVLSQSLFAFSNLNGLRIIGEGVTITDAAEYVGTQDATLIEFIASRNIFVRGVDFVAPLKANYTTPHGLTHLRFSQGCSVANIAGTFTGGWAALAPEKLNADPDSYKTTGIVANIKTNRVERPLSAGYSGCNSRYMLDVTAAGRDFILFGDVEGVTLDVRSADSNLSGSASIDALGGKGPSDIRARIFDRTFARAGTALPYLILQYADESAASIRNVELDFNVFWNSVVNPAAVGGSVLQIAKYNNLGNADTTGRGHVLDGLRVSGIMEPWSARQAVSKIGAFASPDKLRRIRFENITDTTTAGGTLGIDFAAGDALVDVLRVIGCCIPSAANSVTATSGSVVTRDSNINGVLS